MALVMMLAMVRGVLALGPTSVGAASNAQTLPAAGTLNNMIVDTGSVWNSLAPSGDWIFCNSLGNTCVKGLDGWLFTALPTSGLAGQTPVSNSANHFVFTPLVADPGATVGCTPYLSATGTPNVYSCPGPLLDWASSGINTTGVGLSGANAIQCYAFNFPAPVSFNHMIFNVQTLDNSADVYSDAWVLGSTGAIVAHTAAASYTTTGIKDRATVEGTVLFKAGTRYDWCWTGNATVLKVGQSAALNAMGGGVNSSSTSSSAVITSPISVPADSWSTGVPVLAVHS